MKKLKVILMVLLGVSINLLIVAGGIFYAKSKVAPHVDRDISYNGLMILKDYKVGIAFTDDNEILKTEYCYAIPSGFVYQKLFGSDLLFRIDDKEKSIK